MYGGDSGVGDYKWFGRAVMARIKNRDTNDDTDIMQSWQNGSDNENSSVSVKSV